MENLIQTFEALDDQGRIHTLHVYQTEVPCGTRGNPSATIPGMKRIVTADGLSVIRHSKGEYKVTETGQILRAMGTDAP